MRCPSTKALVAAFKIDSSTANKIRAIAKAADDADDLQKIIEKKCPSTADYVSNMHGSPYGSRMWRVTVALHAINDIIGGYGVEGLGPTSGPNYAPPYEYINFGDTYSTTIVYHRSTDVLSIGSWGDIAEKHPSWE